MYLQQNTELEVQLDLCVSVSKNVLNILFQTWNWSGWKRKRKRKKKSENTKKKKKKKKKKSW